MIEESIKLALALGRYSSQEVSKLRSLHPITHTEYGQIILDDRSYVLYLCEDRSLRLFSEVLLYPLEDLPLIINNDYWGAAKQILKWRIEIGK